MFFALMATLETGVPFACGTSLTAQPGNNACNPSKVVTGAAVGTNGNPPLTDKLEPTSDGAGVPPDSGVDPTAVGVAIPTPNDGDNNVGVGVANGLAVADVGAAKLAPFGTSDGLAPAGGNPLTNGPVSDGVGAGDNVRLADVGRPVGPLAPFGAADGLTVDPPIGGNGGGGLDGIGGADPVGFKKGSIAEPPAADAAPLPPLGNSDSDLLSSSSSSSAKLTSLGAGDAAPVISGPPSPPSPCSSSSSPSSGGDIPPSLWPPIGIENGMKLALGRPPPNSGDPLGISATGGAAARTDS
jgi:hypothetical protein